MTKEKELIAPCGMYCGVCSRYLAQKNDLKSNGLKVPYCTGCRIRKKQCAFLKKRCDLLTKDKVKYCYECPAYPCKRLLHIDERYRALYRTSFIGNLNYIKKNGEEKFLVKEKSEWKCPECGDVICCHNGICFSCGTGKLRKKKRLYRWKD